jgi:hypothetical protein
MIRLKHDDPGVTLLTVLFGGASEPRHVRFVPPRVLEIDTPRLPVTEVWGIACPTHRDPALARLRGLIGRDAEGKTVVARVRRRP